MMPVTPSNCHAPSGSSGAPLHPSVVASAEPSPASPTTSADAASPVALASGPLATPSLEEQAARIHAKAIDDAPATQRRHIPRSFYSRVALARASAVRLLRRR